MFPIGRPIGGFWQESVTPRIVDQIVVFLDRTHFNNVIASNQFSRGVAGEYLPAAGTSGSRVPVPRPSSISPPVAEVGGSIVAQDTSRRAIGRATSNTTVRAVITVRSPVSCACSNASPLSQMMLL